MSFTQHILPQSRFGGHFAIPPNRTITYLAFFQLLASITDRVNHNGRYGPGPDMFDDPYRRGNGGGYWDDRFPNSPERGVPSNGRGPPANSFVAPLLSCIDSHLMSDLDPTSFVTLSSRSQMPAPSELPHLVTFRYFADFMRATSPHIADDKDKLGEQWKRYRQDYTRKQLVYFFEENKSRPWFREKYQPGPEFEELRARLKKKGREGKVARFVQGLENGDFDIVNYDYLRQSSVSLSW